MRSFYHHRTDRLRRVRNAVIVLTASFCAEISMIAFFVFFFELFGASDERLMTGALMTAAGSVLIGALICFAAEETAHSRISNNSRYTYLDVQQKAVVYSRYASSFRVLGERRVYRELYYIPLKGFKSAEVSENGRKLTVKGDIRRYCMFSDDLGYHVKNGDIDFDRWWLNHGGFTGLESVVIPDCFTDPKQLKAAFAEAKKRFDEIPPPKKYEFREADFIRRRPKPRVMPEDLSFRREWK